MTFETVPEAPSDWERKTVNELAEVNPYYPVVSGKVYPFLEMAAVAENFGGIIEYAYRRLDSSGLSKFKLNDILFGKITPCPENGKVALVDRLPGEFGIGSTEFITLSPRSGNDPKFVYYLICFNPIRGRAVSRMEGSTGRLRISEDTFTKWLTVAVPRLPEQRAIAAVLDAADAAIERTRGAIAAARRLRRGLVQTLLSWGIGQDGRIRNPERRRSEFVDTPQGSFPKSWEFVRTRDVANVGSGVTLGQDLSGIKTVELPYLRVANVQDGFIDTSEMKTVRVPESDVADYLLQPGDVLMTEGGDFDKLGRGGVWDGRISPCLHQNHVFRVRPHKDVLDSHYLGAVIASQYGKRYFMRIAKRTTNLASINKTQLNAFPFFRPPLSEQERIVEILNAAEENIMALEIASQVHERLKRGLMQVLLTGKVRVPTSNSFELENR